MAKGGDQITLAGTLQRSLHMEALFKGTRLRAGRNVRVTIRKDKSPDKIKRYTVHFFFGGPSSSPGTSFH